MRVKRHACVNSHVSERPCVTETACVSGVVTSVPGCVLPSTPCVNEAQCVREAVCVSETVCVDEAPCVSETPRVSVPTCVSSMVCVKEMVRVNEARCVRGTACVRSLYVREMTVGMRENATASPCPSAMVECVSVVARRSVCVEQRR